MTKICRWSVVLQVALFILPVAQAKTHKDNYSVPCSALWRGVNDTLRNSGKYLIVYINDTTMTATFKLGSVLTGKRTNSVALNRTGENSCEMQIQTAFSGLVNNDYGDFKKRVDESISKLPKLADTPGSQNAYTGVSSKTPDILLGGSADDQKFPSGTKAGQTPSEVESVLGKPTDIVGVKDSLIYIYPGYKLIFEKGILTEIK